MNIDGIHVELANIEAIGKVIYGDQGRQVPAYEVTFKIKSVQNDPIDVKFNVYTPNGWGHARNEAWQTLLRISAKISEVATFHANNPTID